MPKPQGLGRGGKVEMSVAIHIYRLGETKYIPSPPSFAALSFPAVPTSSVWRAQQGQMCRSVASGTQQVAQPLEENECPSMRDKMTSKEAQTHILLMWRHMDHFSHHHSDCTHIQTLLGGLFTKNTCLKSQHPFWCHLPGSPMERQACVAGSLKEFELLVLTA